MQAQTWDSASFNLCISDLLPSISSVLPLSFQTLTIVPKSGKRAWCFRPFPSLIPSHSKTMERCRVLCFVHCFSFDEEYTFLLSVDYGFISILGLVCEPDLSSFLFLFRFNCRKHFRFCPLESSYCTKLFFNVASRDAWRASSAESNFIHLNRQARRPQYMLTRNLWQTGSARFCCELRTHVILISDWAQPLEIARTC